MARGRPRSGLPRHPVLPGDPNAALLFDSLHHHGGVSADPADARDGETWMRTDAASAQLWGMHNGVAVLLATPAGVAPSAHASEHHQGGGDPLDLDSIAGILDADKLYGVASLAGLQASSIATDDLVVSLSLTTGPFTFSGLGVGMAPFDGIPSTAAKVINFDADLLDGQHGPYYLDRAVHTGTQDVSTLVPGADNGVLYVNTGLPTWGLLMDASISGTAAIAWSKISKTGSSLADLATRSAATLNSGLLDDARLSTNIPRLASLNTYTQGQVVQRTASTNLALRFSTAAGVYTEVMVDGSYAMGAGGSARDVRIRRGAAGEIHIDNNVGGAAKLHVLGEVEVGTALRHSGTTAGFFGTAPAARAAAYTPTNVTTDRAFDADATSLDEVADVLGTLIADLKTYGLLQ